MALVVETKDIKIYQGEAKDWLGFEPIDLVFTNPYGPLPRSLYGHPMVIHQWVHRRKEAEEWTGNKLTHHIGIWNRNKEAFWSANILPKDRHFVDIGEFVPEQPGWYPEAMVRRLLKMYGRDGWTIWDGFMGRGTVGKVAVELGMKYVGIERLSSHITIAREYLNV